MKHGIKHRRHMTKGKIWFFINMFCSVIYLVWRIFFTIPFAYGVVSVAAGAALLVVEALGMVEAFVHFANMYSVGSYKLPEIQDKSEYPHVDIFIATYSEEPELLYKTINGCKHMEYPDKNKVHIYLCDDNRRPEMRKLAERMGVNYLDRPDNKGAKAGNLNHALAHSTSPYVVTFDADMIPKSDFLMKTMPYFVDAERRNAGRAKEDQIKLGFLQSPQCFYNPDLFQFNLFSEQRIPNEQDYFYRDIQVARTKSNSVIYGGSNTVLSREALADVGGFFTEAITEDFATGILIEKKGYVTLGTGEPLASGMSATDLQGLIQQRVRWARGVIATGRKMSIFTSKDLSFAQKINYWASIWYWYAPVKRIIYIMSPILYATFGFTVFECTLPQVFLFWLPMYISSNISLRMLSNNIRTTKWTSIYETVLFPYMLLPVLLESVGITLKKFKVTKKETQQNQKGKNTVYSIPFLILILLSLIGITRCIITMFDSGSFGPIVVLFWLVNNLFLLVMSLFFVDGRVPYRKAERVSVRMDCELYTGTNRLKGRTRDISETGLSVFLDKPWYIEEDSEVTVRLKSEMYEAELKAQVVFVSQIGEQWNYSMKITDYTNSYDAYLQMLYDRVPVLPQQIKKGSGSFEDLKLNTKKRVQAPRYQKRQHPRVQLEIRVPYRKKDAGAACKGKLPEVFLRDFNYVYVSLSGAKLQEEIVLLLEEGLEIECAFEGNLRMGNKLYRVENTKEFVGDKKRERQLVEWLSETNRTIADRKVQNQQQITRPPQSTEFSEMDLL